MNGAGNFTLRAGPNRTLLQTVGFTASSYDKLEFDFNRILSNFSSLFKADTTLNLTLSLENFTLATGQTKDFRVIYSFAHVYLDNNQTKPAVNNSNASNTTTNGTRPNTTNSTNSTNGTRTNTTNGTNSTNATNSSNSSNNSNTTNSSSTIQRFGFRVELLNKVNLGKDA